MRSIARMLASTSGALTMVSVVKATSAMAVALRGSAMASSSKRRWTHCRRLLDLRSLVAADRSTSWYRSAGAAAAPTTECSGSFAISLEICVIDEVVLRVRGCGRGSRTVRTRLHPSPRGEVRAARGGAREPRDVPRTGAGAHGARLRSPALARRGVSRFHTLWRYQPWFRTGPLRDVRSRALLVARIMEGHEGPLRPRGCE